MTLLMSEVVGDIRKGIPVIVLDAADRENEGDLVIAGELANEDNLAFTARHARGIMCIPCDGHILDRLDIPMMVQRSTDRRQTAFTVSVDAANGISTGVPVSDRLKTIKVLLDPNSKPSDLTRPGHLFPLRGHPMGLRGRQGHTEASIELMRIAGLKPVTVISEIMNDDGTMARGKLLGEFAKRWNLKVISIPYIIRYLDEQVVKQNITAVILTAGNVREDLVAMSGSNCSAMIPVNGKPAIYWNMTYLVGLGVSRFVVVCRPEMRRLKMYADSMFGSVADIRFVEGSPTGGPGDSLLCGLRYVDTTGVLIVLGDTVFSFQSSEESSIQQLDDFVLVDEVKDPERWCMAQISSDSVVRRLFDKSPECEPDCKALIGVYKISDARLLATRLEEAAGRNGIDRRRTEISDGLESYRLLKPTRAVPASKWLDLGNPDNLIGSRKKSIVVRAYNSFSFDDLLGTVTKRSEDSKLADEIEYYKSLPSQVAVLFPRLISSGRVDGAHEMTLEYYGYPNLGDLLTYGTLSPALWKRIVKKLFDVVKLFGDTCVSDGKDEYSEAMYIAKTEREFAAFESQSEEFRYLLNQERLRINGQMYANYRIIWPEIKRFVREKLLDYRSSVIHGDCCLANIIYDSNSDTLRFVDPRGSFGAKGILGDIRYDVTKLYHSFDGGYEFLINDMFALETGGEYKLRLINGEAREEPRRVFEDVFFSGFDRREIKTIEGTIYVGMCARHYDSPKRQVAMYLTGIKLLNESLKDL